MRLISNEKGVTMMRLDEGVKIVGVALTEHAEPEEEAATEETIAENTEVKGE